MSRVLVLVRHGESAFNARDIFTGWADPPLTSKGEHQAEAVAAQLGARNLRVEAAFCSALHRARRSAELILQRAGPVAPLVADAALNERDYGELTGLGKAAATEQWGADQVRAWRRGWTDTPPAGESLRDTAARVLPFYIGHILPLVMRGRTTLVVAHGNSLRALVMALEGLTAATVADVELVTGEVRVYHLASDTTLESREILVV